jgi:hypothetical protein
MGVAGLYTSTLFRFDPRLFDHVGPALLQRYKGKVGIEAFASYHGLRPSEEPA